MSGRGIMGETTTISTPTTKIKTIRGGTGGTGGITGMITETEGTETTGIGRTIKGLASSGWRGGSVRKRTDAFTPTLVGRDSMTWL